MVKMFSNTTRWCHVTALRQMGRSCRDIQQKPSIAQSYYTRALQLMDGVENEDKLPLERDYQVGESFVWQ